MILRSNTDLLKMNSPIKALFFRKFGYSLQAFVQFYHKLSSSFYLRGRKYFFSDDLLLQMVSICLQGQKGPEERPPLKFSVAETEAAAKPATITIRVNQNFTDGKKELMLNHVHFFCLKFSIFGFLTCLKTILFFLFFRSREYT